MEVQVHLQVNVTPTVVVWSEGGLARLRVFRSLDLAQQFVTENSLWQNGAAIYDENGGSLETPRDPAGGVTVDVTA